MFTLRVFRSSAFCCANPGCLISSKILFISHSSLSPASPVYLHVPFPLPRVWFEIFRNYFLLRGADPSKYLYLSLRITEGKLELQRLRCFLKLRGTEGKGRSGCPHGLYPLGRAGTHRPSMAVARIGLLSVWEKQSDISLFSFHLSALPQLPVVFKYL